MADEKITATTVEEGLEHGFIGVARKVDPVAARIDGAVVNSDDAPEEPQTKATGPGAGQPSKQSEKASDKK